jgi:hypothetical protein
VASAGSSTGAALSLPAPPSIVRADGNVVAAVVPGNRKGRCAEIVLWPMGRAAKTIKTIVQCDADGAGLDAVVDLALGGQTALWQETNGGNNLELSVSKATLTHPKEQEVSYVENGGGAAGDTAGDWTGSLVGHGSLLAYESWKECDRVGGDYARPCSQDRPDLYAQRLHRVGGRVLVFGPESFFPVWTDGHAILIWHADKTLVLVDSGGRVLWRHVAVPGLIGAAFQGSQLVGLTRKALVIWSLPDIEPRRTIPLVAAKRVLEDLDGGVAVLGRKGTTELVRLSDSRRATLAHAAHAQLEPKGLYFADGRTLRFVPRSSIRFG